jgi:pyruvate formate lyase activating enzyme
MSGELTGFVVNTQRFCLHDGPGIRTTVFLKGCLLRCQWCANPEAVKLAPELAFSEPLCNGCGECPAACPKSAIDMDPGGLPRISREQCDACGECVRACLREALCVYGRSWSVQEAFEEVCRDEEFYGAGGGVTLSGGEPLLQADFSAALLSRCRDAGIGTAIETSGSAPQEDLKRVLEHTDVVMYDLKHMNSPDHQRLTGRRNERILDNARFVVKTAAVEVQFRMPLIPGLNDSQDNIEATGEFLGELQGSGASIELMLYHRLGKAKYAALGQPYPMDEDLRVGAEQIARVKHAFEKMGVHCSVSLEGAPI